MTPAQLAAYLGPALAMAAIASGILFLALRHLTSFRPEGAHLLTLFLVLFFLTLTQYPLPRPGTLDCSAGGVQPILRPFAFLDRFATLWRRDAPLGAWLGDKVVQASGMNFLLCAAIGAAWMRHARSRHPTPVRAILASVLFGLAISSLAEISQATGLFGLYPCPYRHFETDDLILNVSGVVAGAMAMIALQGRRRSGRKAKT